MNEILLTMSRQQYTKCFINTMKYMYRIYTSVNTTAIQKQSGLKTESTKGRCLHSRLDWSTCTQSVQASMLICFVLIKINIYSWIFNAPNGSRFKYSILWFI